MEHMKEVELQTMEVKTHEAIPMDADAMRFLYELGTKSRDFKAVEIGGRTYVNTENGELQELEPFEEPVPTGFKAFTLFGLVRWLKEDVEGLFAKFPRLYVQVQSPTEVAVLTNGIGRYKARECVAFCNAEIPRIRFDEYMDQESFLIHLQTRFQDKEDFETVAGLAGNVRREYEAKNADDGISQRVTVRDGVSAVKEAIVKNPFTLAPNRTFEEVEQPVSPFVLRVHKEEDNLEVALFEADGGAWKNEAVKRVGAWLEEQLFGLPVVVIA